MRMKRIVAITAILSLPFFFTGCEFLDKVKEEIDNLKHKYEEYYGDKNERGERPFQVVFQQNENDKTAVISSVCDYNQPISHIYFMTQTDAGNNYFKATHSLSSYPFRGVLKPFWDFRYTNPVSPFLRNGDGSYLPDYASLSGLDARKGDRNTIIGTPFAQTDPSGVVGQSKCVGGHIAAGTTLNLYDAPEQALIYAGIANTFTYQIHPNNHIRPWKADGSGNLMLQANFDKPIYRNFESNTGGSVAFNIMLYNPKSKLHLNYVIGIYAFGSAWQTEMAGIKFDPTTNIVHVATVIKDDSWWCTKSPKSLAIQEVVNTPNKTNRDDGRWNDFYRVNISYNNLKAVLDELQKNPPPSVAGINFGQAPQDWEVILLAVQYELAEEGGKALVSGSFSGFEAYLSRLPL